MDDDKILSMHYDIYGPINERGRRRGFTFTRSLFFLTLYFKKHMYL